MFDFFPMQFFEQCHFKNNKTFENPYILILYCKASIDAITQDFGTELLMVDLSSWKPAWLLSIFFHTTAAPP